MNLVTVAIGLLGVLYGLYTLYARKNTPEKFAKLTAMKDKFGPGPGNLIHFIAYTLLPVVFGLLLLYRGLNGSALF